MLPLLPAVLAAVPPSLVTEVFKLVNHLAAPGQQWEDLLAAKERYINDRYIAQDRIYDPDSLPYFKIIPKFVGAVAPGAAVEVRGTCWKSARASVREMEGGAVEVVVSLLGPASLLCHTSFVITSAQQTLVKEWWLPGEHRVELETPVGPAERWDLLERGPRIFVYPLPPEEVAANLAATLALFEPVLTQAVQPFFADLNREFLSAFAGIEMEEREGAPEILELDPATVR